MIPFIENYSNQIEVLCWYKSERLDYCEPFSFKEISFIEFLKGFFKKI